MASLFTKKSIGIILVNKSMNKVLFIQKRCTYAFHDFVIGRYKKSDTYQMSKMFSQMKLQEKIVIKSLNYTHMWYNLYLYDTNGSNYTYCYKKFKTNFLDNDTTLLLHLINTTGYINDPIYEFPKGHKKTKDEPNILTAMREVQEETGIKQNQYKIIPHKKLVNVIKDGDIRYLTIYYIAHMLVDVNPVIDINSWEQYIEILAIKWLSLSEIFNDEKGDKKLYTMSKKVLKYVRNIYREL